MRLRHGDRGRSSRYHLDDARDRRRRRRRKRPDHDSRGCPSHLTERRTLGWPSTMWSLCDSARLYACASDCRARHSATSMRGKSLIASTWVRLHAVGGVTIIIAASHRRVANAVPRHITLRCWGRVGPTPNDKVPCEIALCVERRETSRARYYATCTRKPGPTFRARIHVPGATPHAARRCAVMPPATSCDQKGCNHDVSPTPRKNDISSRFTSGPRPGVPSHETI